MSVNQQTIDPLGEFLTVSQVAAVFGCSEKTIYDMVFRGTIKAVRLGKGGPRSAIRIPRKAIDALNGQAAI